MDPVIVAMKTNDPEKMDFAFKTLAKAFIGGVDYKPFADKKVPPFEMGSTQGGNEQGVRTGKIHNPDRL